MQKFHRKNSERKYILSSAVCSAEEYSGSITKDEYKTSQAAIKYFRVFCDGFVRCGVSISVFSKRPTNKMKSGRLYIPAKKENVDGIAYHYCRLINIRFLGDLYATVASFFWYLSSENCKKNDVVFMDPLNVSICIGTIAACKLRKIPMVAYITDIPTHYVYGNGKMSAHQKASLKIEKAVGAYIFITRQMNAEVNVKGKPYMVMEGFVDERLRDITIEFSQKYKRKVCMYTGGLEKIYGLDMLVEGFLKADLSDSELHIYGAGSFANQIKEYAKLDERIKYFGCRDNEIVVKEQMKATLLVNPRYTDAEYTKFSFPSKNLEYAVSGTPTLTTALPGMPEEYYPHVFVLEDETIDGMANKIKEIMSLPTQELFIFGQETKKWVLENKNCRVQIQKILQFVNESF